MTEAEPYRDYHKSSRRKLGVLERDFHVDITDRDLLPSNSTAAFHILLSGGPKVFFIETYSHAFERLALAAKILKRSTDITALYVIIISL